ncbi:competence protein ComFC [Clostridium cavendishii DSM 21758]|uniref:Competence protein ComFC n=1 Tax=Clostridium cavendishii DSM 21758 TaxID=1121302 RepID=A0A1M6H1Q9_9CLOT|nr:phosphoribosyltransferase family protein [Clostridium cavendishii]SHJ16153.1 competence protein ComFC [Clostridium cavendishii DSM 21758]
MGFRIIKIVEYFFKCLKEVIYPSLNKCLTCKSEIEDDFLCTSCKKNIIRVEGAYFIDGIKSYSVGYYSKTIKKLIKSFKYDKNFESGEYLANLLIEKINSEKLNIDLITYVPSSKLALKKRGFNQCELLAKIVASSAKVPCLELLDRVEDVKEQKRLTKEERFINMKKAFKIKSNIDIKVNNILLIDDVVTTGATLTACVFEIKKYKKFNIIILTVAKSYI